MQIDTTAGVKDRVIQATDGSGSAGTQNYGISCEGTRLPPISFMDDGFAAIAGENIKIYGPGDKDCFLELGGTVAQGASLKSDANGKGLSTTTANDWVAAIAMEAGVSGDLVRVMPTEPKLY